ncbi:MAG: hypothetical protein ACYCSR_06025 [Thiomonas sp.]
MKPTTPELNSQVREHLAKLKPAEAHSVGRSSSSRAAFVAMVEKLASQPATPKESK